MRKVIILISNSKVLNISVGQISSLPMTVNDSRIKESMTVLGYYISHPALIVGNLKFTLNDGSVTISNAKVMDGTTSNGMWIGFMESRPSLV